MSLRESGSFISDTLHPRHDTFSLVKKDITIVVLAYNEEKNIVPAIEGLVDALRGYTDKYEIVLIEDGSTDGTPAAADALAKRFKGIRVFHHIRNMGFGKSFLDGVAKATMTYVVGFPGDNDTSPLSLRAMMERIGKADLIISYTANTDARSVARRIVSKTYIILMNVLFGLHLRYFNGSFICKTEDLRTLPIVSEGFAVYSEAKIRLLKKGASFMEVPFIHTGRKFGVSKATSAKSVWETLKTTGALVKDIYFTKSKLKVQMPNQI